MDENQNESKIESKNESIKELTPKELELMLKSERATGRGQGVLYTLLAVSAAAIIVFLCIAFAGGISKSKSDIIDDSVIEKSQILWNMITSKYLWEEDIDAEKTRDDIYRSIIGSLDDPYSTYYTKSDLDEFIEDKNGEYSGIGAYISQRIDTNDIVITYPMPDSPAEEAGILANDYIYEVDGENVIGQDLDIVVSKIKGPEGTTVDIGVKHNNEGEIETITVTRRTIISISTEHEMLDDNIGYIWVLDFEGKVEEQFNDDFEDLKSQGMEGLIVDLRNNPGGDLDIISRICDKFLDEGIIVTIKEKDGKTEEIKSDAECEKLPIVIITNKNSASASEIFTGALKDRGVAKVVGKTTYGKGIVQSVYKLSDGSGIKLTEAEYLLPNGECIHGKGIEPDYEIDLDIEAYKKDGTDSQKEKAIEVMKELLK